MNLLNTFLIGRRIHCCTAASVVSRSLQDGYVAILMTATTTQPLRSRRRLHGYDYS